MLEDIAGAYGGRFFLAAGGVGIALLCLVGVLWLLRHRAPSPFVRGGRNRQPRLQVLDAAAVDARRRLVLVRRDGVEHLIMIGGPTDIVIESGITGSGAVISVPVSAPAPASAFEAITAADPEPATFRPEPPRAITRPQQRPADPFDLPAAVPVATPVRAQATPPSAVEPQRPISPPVERAQPAPAPQAVRERIAPERPAEVQAADILDAARQRVLPQQERAAQAPAAANAEPPAARPAPVAPPVAAVAPASRPRELGGDFQRLLDAEMSNNLAAERIVGQTPAAPRTPQPVPAASRREPELTPVTGADAALQQEVARIFGEMSVSREK